MANRLTQNWTWLITHFILSSFSCSDDAIVLSFRQIGSYGRFG